jgi:hypothetical protein
MKKMLTAAAIVAGSIMIASPASASSGSVSVSCAGGLTVHLSGFPSEAPAPDKGNHVRITVASRVVVDTGMGTEFSGHYSFPQNGLIHDWEVKAGDGKSDYAVYRFGTIGPCGSRPHVEPAPRAVKPRAIKPHVTTAPKVSDQKQSTKHEVTKPKVKAPVWQPTQEYGRQHPIEPGAVAQTMPVAAEGEFHPNTGALIAIGAVMLMFLSAITSGIVGTLRRGER